VRAETFLRMYRVLEGLLEEKYGASNSSVVMDYLNNPASEPVRAKLNMCREMRNLLTHNAGDNGEPICEPSKRVLDDMYAIIDHVEKPRLARDAATHVEQLMTAQQEDPVLPIMRKMTQMGYSHIPVLTDGALYGVFSAACLMEHLANGGYINEQTRMHHLNKYLCIDKRSTGKYAFVAENATCAECISIFETPPAKNRRTPAIFITQTGAPDLPILGMLTPWDVLGKDA